MQISNPKLTSVTKYIVKNLKHAVFFYDEVILFSCSPFIILPSICQCKNKEKLTDRCTSDRDLEKGLSGFSSLLASNI